MTRPTLVPMPLLAAAAAVAAAGALALPAAAQAEEPTQLHIHVKDADGTGVDITVPFALTKLAPEEVMADLDVDLDVDDHHADVHRLRAAWKALQALPDGEQIIVQEEDARLVMTKIRGRVNLYVTEHDGEQVLIDLPAALVDALFAGDGDELKVEEALRALGDAGKDAWIEIRADDEQVRIWTS